MYAIRSYYAIIFFEIGRVINRWDGYIVITSYSRQYRKLYEIEVDGKQVVTYREAILQETLPESVVIIGAGAIGVEFATIWSSYGVKVTLVEMLDRVVPNEDPEISKELKKSFDKRDISSYNFV